ncbi:MAG TPA: HlyD family efflux transporter periplasmic adaptor subunit [Thermoanaerobaculia bacterium]|nr:HlyD family efflux transporter periplasmic adaptor subunit [Thermoanaerobaculia bacterium]
MSDLGELLDRRDFSETVDAIVHARPRYTALFFPLFTLTFFAALAWLAFVPFEQTIHARGDIRVAGNAVNLHAQQEGRVLTVAAREGAFVEKGAVLFRLDDATLRMDLTRLSTETDRARETITLLAAQRERARSRGAVEVGRISRDVARHRTLNEEGILPQEMVENLESERSARAESSRQEQLAIEAEEVAARQALTRLESERARTLRILDEQTLRAPESGTITRLQVPAPGQYLTRGTVLAEITPRGRPMEFEALVAPHDIARVRPGLTTRLELDAYPRRQYGDLPGRVTFIAPDRDKNGYRIRIAVTPPARDIDLRTGLTGTVAVISDRSPLYRVVGERLGFIR